MINIYCQEILEVILSFYRITKESELMAIKDYYLIADTETTLTDKVADFGAVVIDRKGNVKNQCAVLVKGIFGVDPLFYLRGEDNTSIWSEQGKDRRFDAYNLMLDEGTRMLASVAAINRWLERVKGEYDPIVTAYNLPFDIDKCQKTGIDLTPFDRSFCLWQASFNKWGRTKAYKRFVLDIHGFNPPTPKGNMSYKTNAEIMARFALKNALLADEPHTALEDIIYYELPILRELLKVVTKNDLLNPEVNYSWQAVQVKDHYKPR